VWENLQTFLARHKSDEVHSFGRLFKENQPGKSYYSGGSGIIFSNALLHKLGKAVGDDGLKSEVWARPINGPEDAQTSKSLRQACHRRCSAGFFSCIRVRVLPCTTLMTRHRWDCTVLGLKGFLTIRNLPGLCKCTSPQTAVCLFFHTNHHDAKALDLTSPAPAAVRELMHAHAGSSTWTLSVRPTLMERRYFSRWGQGTNK